MIETIDINLPVKNAHKDNADWSPYPRLSQPQPGFTRKTFIARSELTYIMSCICNVINAEVEEDDSSIPLQVVDLYEKLLSWKDVVPSSLDLSINTMPYNLQLQYIFLTNTAIQFCEY